MSGTPDAGLAEALPPRGEVSPSGARADGRLRAIFDGQYDFVWRFLRRLGLHDADADDAAQQVFLVASRRIDAIVVGKERAFLVSTAMHVVAHHRSRQKNRREVSPDDTLDEIRAPGPAPDELLEQRRARALLDEILGALPLDLRTAFVLFEFEQTGVPEIASMLGIPVGTAASRLRRAREAFARHLARARARETQGAGARP